MALVFDAPWRLTRSAQFTLGVKVDGIWGDATNAAYDAAPPTVRNKIRENFERERLSVYSVARVTTTVKEPTTMKPAGIIPKSSPVATVVARANPPTSSVGGLISAAEAEEMAAKAEIKFSLPAGTLIQMLRHEAPRVTVGGATMYAPGRRGGASNRYVGLYQFFDQERNGAGLPYAWGVARNFGRKAGVDIPSIERWADAQTNTLAAAAYAGYHNQQLALKGVKASPAMLYYAHQQGLGAVQKSLATGKVVIAGKQSQESIAYISSAFA